MAYEKTWQFSFNNGHVATSVLDVTQYQAWAIKALLKGELGGLTQGLWTCAGSSDGVTGAMDGVDRWTATYTPSKLVRAIPGSAHSWIVLQSPLINGITWFLLVSLAASTDVQINFYMAKAAFTGGSNLNDPTSTDSWAIGQTSATVNNSGLTNHNHHIILSTSGDFVFFMSNAGGGFASFYLIAVGPVGCQGTDNYPIFTSKFYAATGTAFTNAALLVQSTSNTQPARLSGGGLGTNAIVTPQAMPGFGADALSGGYPDLPTWAAVGSMGGAWHMRGRLPDIGSMPYGNTGGGAASILLTTDGNAVRDALSNVVYVNLGVLWVPANAVPVLA